jgi:glycine betaine/proline transport system substrate-binding protein
VKVSRLLSLLVACLCAGTLVVGTAQAKGKLDLAYVEWDCAVASTSVAQAVLQEKMGYQVEIIPVAAAAMWAAVASGDVEGMVTAWLPVTHADYMARFKADLVDLGPIVGGAKLGWAVPSSVEIDSIADLKGKSAQFKGRIIGIDPGAGLMMLSEEAMKEYGLSGYQLMEGSGATMTAALADAIRTNQPVVVTAWSPHWMFGRWDLKYLDDPKGTLGDEEFIHTIVRKDLKKDMPEVYAFLDNFTWESPEQLQMVMAWNQEPGTTPYRNAVRFIDENPELVNSWIGK